MTQAYLVPGVGNRFIILDTGRKMEKKETQISAEHNRRNCYAIGCVAGILHGIGWRMSKAQDSSGMRGKYATNCAVSTREWESTHDGFIRMGLKIRFRVETGEYDLEIVRVKFNSAKNNSMLIKGGENDRTEVLIWNPQNSEADAGSIDKAFLKVEAKLLARARAVVQHGVNNALTDYLASEHDGYVEDGTLIIPSREICMVEDMVKVRNEGDRTLFLIGEKTMESLQGAVDYAICSFEKKYYPKGVKEEVPILEIQKAAATVPGKQERTLEKFVKGAANIVHGAKKTVLGLF